MKSLGQNLGHQHFKVRKETLRALSKILTVEGAGHNFEHVKVNIKQAISDKNSNVRKEALESCAKMLKLFGPGNLKLY